MVPLKGVSVEGVSEEVCKELPLWKGQPGGKIRLKFRLKVQMVSLTSDVGKPCINSCMLPPVRISFHLIVDYLIC